MRGDHVTRESGAPMACRPARHEGRPGVQHQVRQVRREALMPLQLQRHRVLQPGRAGEGLARCRLRDESNR